MGSRPNPKDPMTSNDEPETTDSSADAGSAKSRRPASSKPGSTSCNKILIVDDDFEIIEAVRYALEGCRT